uniref:Triple functional domain protein n=1 Tax=Echinococcus granulosus TaxID=6210 RepID=A0A068WN13_ECHGR|nr:triple functional domain protein [Echinococcus granulosus]
MSVEIVKEKPPDEKQAHFLDGESVCAKADSPNPTADVLRTDDPTFNDRDQQPSPTPASTTATTENNASADVNGEAEAIAEAIEKRKQPVMELAYSEESYVRRLRVVYELYMPAPYRMPPNSDSTSSTAAASSALPVSPSSFEELASKLPPGGPAVPEDLVARWRILWGNWMQLFEWHTGFYEKLRTLLEEDPDRIPKLFIDSRARLRSIYSKYCENQIKAAHIAEQHKEFFDEWRVHVGDKEDVVSLLMQPVQRIMRYQLPISEIVKWTERAKLPSLPLWQKALDIMKEIPKDTQLILEKHHLFVFSNPQAARIDGFPGVITALGTLRIRGDLLVASLSRSELAEALRSYAKALNVLPSNPASRNSSGLSLLTKLHLQSSSTPEEEAEAPATTTTTAAPTDTGPVNFTFANEPTSLAPNASTAPLPPPSLPLHQKSRSSLEVGEVFQTQPPPPLLPGGQKFVVSRLFLFDRMLLVTEEVKAKRKGTSADAFAQSTYQFRAAINVNKMKFEPHWFMCTFTSEPATTEATGAGVADAIPMGAAGATMVSGNEQYSGTDWASVRAALEFVASDDLRFALWDQTPGRDVIYIIDPQTVATRSAWVVHLRDIQRMQQQLLMALEDPTRFAGGEREWAPNRLGTRVLPPLPLDSPKGSKS